MGILRVAPTNATLHGSLTNVFYGSSVPIPPSPRTLWVGTWRTNLTPTWRRCEKQRGEHGDPFYIKSMSIVGNETDRLDYPWKISLFLTTVHCLGRIPVKFYRDQWDSPERIKGKSQRSNSQESVETETTSCKKALCVATSSAKHISVGLTMFRPV